MVGGRGNSAETGEGIVVAVRVDVGRINGGGAVPRCDGGRGNDRFGVGELGDVFFKSLVDAFFSKRRGLSGNLGVAGDS